MEKKMYIVPVIETIAIDEENVIITSGLTDYASPGIELDDEPLP